MKAARIIIATLLIFILSGLVFSQEPRKLKDSRVRYRGPQDRSTRSVKVDDLKKLAKYIAQAQGDYISSEACGVCHTGIYDWWFASGHAHKLRSAEEARGAGIPHPESVTWNDIKWVIGGFGWKARFIGKDGYIITQGGKNQFNLETRAWTDYHADEQKPYSCGACHTTGYDPAGNQEYLPGVVGTWVYPGIHCERCHGPGKDHVLSGGDETKITVDRSSAMCGECHYRTDPNIIPAKGGFIRHHEQYNEFLKSGHSQTMECVSCHDPHKPGGSSIKLTCQDCHADVAAVYETSEMGEAGVKCVDCHMPYMSKSAVSLRKWVGDVKTHLFIFNLDANAQPFTADGSQANGYITSEYGCLVCHYDRDKAWAATFIGTVHTIQ